MVAFFNKEYTRTNRYNPCPACGDTEGNCQINYTFHRVQCLNTHQDIPGWKYLRDASGGAYWGILVASGEASREGTPSQSDRRLDKERRYRESREAEAKGKLSPSLIDKYTRDLSKFYGLSRRHRENLKSRGLTDEQIDKAGFFSVAPNEKLPALFPTNYPGVKGGSLLVAGEGIFCPAFSLTDEIIGGQVRLDNENSGGKYRWPKGYKSSHLQNGELPITVIQAGPRTGEAWVGEGILKALVAAHKHNKLVTGAAGGNFSGSPEQFQEIVTSLNITIATILPDAGDVKNPQVMRRWQKQYEFFRSLGLFVRVGWWGQVDKHSDDDIDELPSGSAIDYISWEQFLAYAREHGGIKEEPNWWDTKSTNFGDYFERVEAAQQYLEDFTPWTTEVKEERFLRLNLNNLAKGVYLFKSGMGSGKSTLAISIIMHFDEGNVLSYRNSLLQQLSAKTKDKLTHIHSITTNDKQTNRKMRSASPWIAACVDSCFILTNKKVLILEEVDKLLQHMLTGATCRKRRVAIIEGFVRLVQSADYIFCFDADLTATSSRYIEAISGKNIFGIWNKGQVPAWKVNVYGGEKEIRINGDKHSVKEFKNARGGFDKHLINDIMRGKKILITSDSQRYLIGIERLLSYCGVTDVLRVDSYTKTDPLTSYSVNIFLEKPDEYLAENKPRVVLISPTAESSLDINLPYFDCVYGAFFGVLNHRQIMQMLARYRQPVERIIFCRTYSLLNNHASRSPLPSVVARTHFKNQQSTLSLLPIYNYLPVDRERDETIQNGHPEFNYGDKTIENLESLLNANSSKWQSPHFKAVCEFAAFDNYSRANLREFLIRDLNQSGHNAEELPMQNREIFTCINNARDHWLMEEAKSICQSEDIDYQEAIKLWESMNLTPSDRQKVIKAKLKHRLPGFEFDANFVYEHHLKNPQYLNQLELRWAMLNLDKQKLLDTNQLQKSLKYDTEFWDIRCRSLRANLLVDLGVPQLIDKLSEMSEKSFGWTGEDKIIHDFRVTCSHHSQRLLSIFGINVSPDSDPSYLLRRILEKVGVKVVRRRRRVREERKYVYQIDLSTLPEISLLTQLVFEAIDRRFSQPLEMSPTDRKYIKKYISSQLGTKIVVEIDPLKNPHLVNELLKGGASTDNQQLEEICLPLDNSRMMEFELGVPEVLMECESWEQVQEFLSTYSLYERQVAWALLSPTLREKLAIMKRRVE